VLNEVLERLIVEVVERPGLVLENKLEEDDADDVLEDGSPLNELDSVDTLAERDDERVWVDVE
jgi:hypothetical protein